MKDGVNLGMVPRVLSPSIVDRRYRGVGGSSDTTHVLAVSVGFPQREDEGLGELNYFARSSRPQDLPTVLSLPLTPKNFTEGVSVGWVWGGKDFVAGDPKTPTPTFRFQRESCLTLRGSHRTSDHRRLRTPFIVQVRVGLDDLVADVKLSHGVTKCTGSFRLLGTSSRVPGPDSLSGPRF